MKVKDVIKPRNFVAKNAHLAGKAGVHDAKEGKFVKRAKAKEAVRKQIQSTDY
jgi:hypothetical protein